MKVLHKNNISKLMILIVLIIVLAVALRLPDNGLLSTQEEVNDDILRIHSPLNERIIKPIIKEFQESTGIQVEYLSAGTMDLLKTMDNKEDEYLMDVMWGGSREYLDIYKDLFEPYTSINKGEIQQNNNEKDNHYLGYNLLPIVLIYNTKIVSSDEVCTSWEEVLDPKWQGKLAFADPNTSGSAFIALSFMLSLDQKASYNNWDNAKMLINNIDGKILAKSSEVYEGVAAGDFAIGITMEEAAISYINKGEDVGIVYLSEGTPVITDSIALMKDAKNKDNAKLFIDFVLSKKVQTYMVDHFYLRSIRDDVEIPVGLEPMDKINIFNSSDLNTYTKKVEVLKLWDELKEKTEEVGN